MHIPRTSETMRSQCTPYGTALEVAPGEVESPEVPWSALTAMDDADVDEDSSDISLESISSLVAV
jgi:hypothetical protein